MDSSDGIFSRYRGDDVLDRSKWFFLFMIIASVKEMVILRGIDALVSEGLSLRGSSQSVVIGGEFLEDELLAAKKDRQR